MSDNRLPPRLSPAEARRIDQTCDRFEAAWKAGRRPRPEEYLDASGEPVRSALLRQLLLADWDCRRRAGDEPHARDYLARFPDDPALIDDISREMIESPDSTRGGPDGSHALDTPGPGVRAPSAPGEVVAGVESGSARYELLREVGHGGAGVVFRGRDRFLGRELAVKVLREVYRDTPEVRRRFIEEARIGSQLQHPAIVPVYELGWFDDRRPYFTMKLVEGRTLAALLKDRADPGQDLTRLLGIMEQVCQAMAYAHARRVVHRDLKPANIMVGAFGEVQVMDWGFAKVLAGDEASPGALSPDEDAPGPAPAPPASGRDGASQSGVVMGTPAYMPPEQAQGKAGLIDPRADVFALGAILCEVLTGRPPYGAGAIDEVCRQAAEGDLTDAHARLDACEADEALRDLARRCLAVDRLARPPDAGDVARDLAAYLAASQERLRQAQVERAAAEARAKAVGAKAKAERHARRLTLALAAAAVVLLAAVAAGWWQHDRVRQAEALRAAALDGKVEAALDEAADHLNRNDWSGAAAAATRAQELRESGASGRWAGRLDEIRADVELVTRLDEARLLQTEFDSIGRAFHRAKAMPRFAEAFARYGIPAGCDPAEAAARIARRPAPVRYAVTAALENWWLLALNRDAAARDWLWALLQAVDADEWRTKVRQAVAKSDRRALEELAAQDDALRQPSGTLTALANALENFQDHDAAIALLRPAQLRHPDDFWINFELGLSLDRRQPPDHAEALRFYSIAWAMRPAAIDYVYLSFQLARREDWDGVIVAARKAIELHADDARAYNQLGIGLEKKGEWEQAEAAYRKAADLNPDDAFYHCNLGKLLDRRGQADQAAAAYERAIRLAPADAEIQFNLGQFHFRRKDFDAALAAYDKAIALDPGFAKAYHSRGDALMEKGRVDDAIAAYQKAIRLDPTSAKTHGNLGTAWQDKGNVERAVASFSQAVALNPRSATNQNNLGTGLEIASDISGAVAAYREAIRLDPRNANAHYNLGRILQEQGLFAEALAEIEEDRRLGSARPDWLLQMARRLVELDAKLPGILDGSEKPATAAEQLDYAGVCKRKGLYGASARLFAAAFAADPALGTSLGTVYRYPAARVAVLAGGGQGQDAPELDAAARARWRKQALDWLRVDLALWADGLNKSTDGRSRVASALRRWQREKDLAGIREPEELAKLPESERAGCLRFWADVEELLVRSLSSPPGK